MEVVISEPKEEPEVEAGGCGGDDAGLDRHADQAREHPLRLVVAVCVLLGSIKLARDAVDHTKRHTISQRAGAIQAQRRCTHQVHHANGDEHVYERAAAEPDLARARSAAFHYWTQGCAEGILTQTIG